MGTFIIMILSVITFLKRSDEITVFGHSVSHQATFKALAVISITSLLILIGFFTLLILEPDKKFLDLLFEAVSAACTVGLSRGITENLHAGSQVALSNVCWSFRATDIGLFNRNTE